MTYFIYYAFRQILNPLEKFSIFCLLYLEMSETWREIIYKCDFFTVCLDKITKLTQEMKIIESSFWIKFFSISTKISILKLEKKKKKIESNRIMSAIDVFENCYPPYIAIELSNRL